MRLLITSEAQAHPDVAASYLTESWDRNVAAVGDAQGALSEDGRPVVAELHMAAEQLTWLVLGAPLNALQLAGGPDTVLAPVEDAIDLFLARSGPSEQTG